MVKKITYTEKYYSIIFKNANNGGINNNHTYTLRAPRQLYEFLNAATVTSAFRNPCGHTQLNSKGISAIQHNSNFCTQQCRLASPCISD